LHLPEQNHRKLSGSVFYAPVQAGRRLLPGNDGAAYIVPSELVTRK